MAAEAVAEVDGPGQSRDGPMAAARGEAPQPSDRQGGRHGHGEAVAGLHPDTQQGLRQLDAEIAADQAEDDRLAVLEPGPAAREALPVGEHERQLGPDHRAAERPEPDAQPLAPAQAQGRLRAPAQDDGDRHRGEHDQRVRPGEASDPRTASLSQITTDSASPHAAPRRRAARARPRALHGTGRCTRRTG